MSKELGPFMPLYLDDFMGGTMDMGAEEIGAYFLLLGYQWANESIDATPRVIERIARCEYAHAQRVLQKFSICPDGRLRNKRLTEIRQERVDYIRACSIGGQRGMATRYADQPRKGVSKVASKGVSKESYNIPSPPPIATVKDIHHRGDDADSAFSQFWESYPRKVGKAAAQRAWKAAKNKPAIAPILEKIKALKASDQWAKDGGQFIPHPATWIRRGGWDDEAKPATGGMRFRDADAAIGEVLK